MILCCGEALIDMIPAQAADGSPCLVPSPGGAVFNTSLALGRLGADVGLFTGVSDDMFGRLLAKTLGDSQVMSDHLVTLDAPTSLAFVELIDGQAQYTFYTKGAADTILAPEHCPQDVSQFEALFFGGISLCTDPTANTLAGLMQQASAAGRVTMIDPNIRTSFIRNEATYRERLFSMMRDATIVKLSDEDLAWMAGIKGTIGQQVQALSLASDTVVLITQGGDGAMVLKAGQVIASVPGASVTVVDTIGAGDTFNAGFLFAIEAQGLGTPSDIAGAAPDALVQAVTFANTCAAVTVSRRGADVPWAHEVGLG